MATCIPALRKLSALILTSFSLCTANAVVAVEVNPKGLGEALIFPYYTTTGDYDTYINLVNDSDDFKALKVRFRESMNGAVVLAFNLYLSPGDHWSAVVYPTNDAAGAQVASADTSCTVPLSISDGERVPLSADSYAGDAMNGRERTREGFVEVIEMATIGMGLGLGAEDWSDYILHVNGVPGNCRNLANAWEAGNTWAVNSLNGASLANGGLHGYGVLVDVYEGTVASYDALALSNFTRTDAEPLHTAPDAEVPHLGSGDTRFSMLTDAGYITGSADTGVDAVSALLMQASIHNDYILEPSVAAATDWVITFPTKNHYINGSGDSAPFTSAWSASSSFACEETVLDYFDREQRPPFEPPPGFPPLQTPPRQGLCAQANVLSFQPSSPKRSVLEASLERNGHEYVLLEGYDNGWATLSFGPSRAPLTAGSYSLQGLPLVGFSLHRFTNGAVGSPTMPILSNYVGVVAHKGEVIVNEQ